MTRVAPRGTRGRSSVAEVARGLGLEQVGGRRVMLLWGHYRLRPASVSLVGVNILQLFAGLALT